MPNIPAGFRTTGLNVSACQGHFLYAHVPVALVEDDLPPGVSASQVLPGTTNVVFEINSCNQAAVDGVDIGAIHWTTVAVPVGVVGEKQNESMALPVYILEVVTNHAAVHKWLANHEMPATYANLSLTSSATPNGWLRIEGSISGSSGLIYEWVGTAYKPTGVEHKTNLMYYGPDLKSEVVVSDASEKRATGVLRANMRFASDSKVATALDGMVSSPEVRSGSSELELQLVRPRDSS